MDHIKTSLRTTFPARAGEWALAVMLLNFAALLVLNPTMFLLNPTYSSFLLFAPQSVWALLIGTAATVRVVFLVINGMWERSPHLRAAGAFISCLFWFLISMGLLDNGYDASLAIYPVLLVFDSYNGLRALDEAAVADRVISERRRQAHAVRPSR